MNYRKTRLGFCIILCLIIFIYQQAKAVDYLMEELPFLTNSIITTADLFDSGIEQLIMGRDNIVKIYDQGAVVATITDFVGNVTALAVGDLTGDFRPEIVIGTDNCNIYVYQRINDNWKQIYERRYLWTPVVHIEVPDITGNGWGAVLVRTERGEEFVFLSFNGTLEMFWRSQPTERIKYITAADLTGDGGAEVVFSHNSGYVGVLSWIDGQLENIWQNYPWGTIDSLMIAKLAANDLPEIMVITGQHILYCWKWNGKTFSTTRHYPVELSGNNTKYISQLGLTDLSLVSGITTYAVKASSLQKQNSFAITNVSDLFMVNKTMIIKDPSGHYYQLHMIDPDKMQIYFNNKPQHGLKVKVHNGTLYLALDELADALNLIRFGTERIFLMKGLKHLVIDTKANMILWKNTPLPLNEPLLTSDEKLFVPISILSSLGYDTRLDYTNNELHLLHQFGWW